MARKSAAFVLFLAVACTMPPTTMADEGSYYKCTQDTYTCACTPTNQQTPYTDWKECDRECCPTWTCDHNAHQCALDLAGGYSRASCAESCGITHNGYTCEYDATGPGCVPTLLSYQSKLSCEIACGTNKVTLCVYKCGASYFQRCKSLLPGETELCWNQDITAASSALDMANPSTTTSTSVPDSALEAPSGHCMKAGDPCLAMPCCGTLSCDVNHKFCTDGNPPQPIVLTCPDTGKPAEFQAVLSMQGLEQCMAYDCSYTEGPKKPCVGLTNCPETASDTPCPPADSANKWSIAPEGAVPRPASTEYMGIAELAPPRKHLLRSSKGAVITHAVKYTHPATGKIFRATYDTKLTDKHEVLSVDQEEQIEALSCSTTGTPGVMTLFLGANSSAEATGQRKGFVERLRELPIVTVSPVWKCLFNDYASRNDTRTVSLRRTTAILFVSPGFEHVNVSTVASSYQEIFQEAHVSMQTSVFPEPVHFNEGSEHAPLRDIHHQYAQKMTGYHVGQRAQAAQKLRGFFSFIGNLISSAWKMVQKLADEVAKAAEALKAAIEAFITGDINWDKSISLASITYNYDKSTHSAAQKNIALSDNVVCTECYTDLEVTLNFDFHMSDYSVKHVGCFIEGDLIHHVDMTSTQSERVKDVTFDKVLDILHFPDIHFLLGPVPISVKTTVPVHGGLTLEYAEAGDLRAESHITGHVKYGMQWTQEDHFQFIHEHSLTHDGSVSSTGSVDTAVLVYIMPVVWINIDHIGGPNVGVKGFVEPAVDFEQTNSLCSPGGGAGASYIVNFGLQLSIGAHIDIEFVGKTFINKTFEPSVIWSHKWPLASGCVEEVDSNFTSRTALAQPYRMVDGVAYNGPITMTNASGCDAAHTVHVSAQFVISDEGDVLFGIGPNDNFVRRAASDVEPYNIGCLGQTWYKMSYGKLAPYSAPAGVTQIQYLNCTLDAFKEGYTYSQVGGKASFSSDFSSLTIDTHSTCFKPIVLLRERKPGSARTSEHDIVWP